jgi:transcriptional regulator with XRE-family HTH domain
MPRSVRPQEIKVGVGHRLREAVVAIGLTQRVFAAEVRAAENTFSQWCSGVALLDVLVAIRIADRFAVTLDFLYRGRLETLPEDLRRKINAARGVQDGDPGEAQGIYAVQPRQRKAGQRRKRT